MKSSLTLAGMALCCCMQAAVAADKPADMGKQEYMNSCAVCHGPDGKGNTQITDILKTSPPNLRQLAKNNGGVFPVARVYETIDGRQQFKAHGTRDMPIWGQRYTIDVKPAFDDYQYNPEIFVRARILSLVEYIDRLQDK